MINEELVTGESLLELIKLLIKEKQYEGVSLLFTSASEAERNLRCIGEIENDLYQDVVLKHLTDVNHNENPALYSCAEELLKICAVHGSPDVLLLELMDLVEENMSEYVFTTALRAMQEILLRMDKTKPGALEWALLSIQVRLKKLPVPSFLKVGYDEKQSQLLEQDKQIQTLLMYYITVGLFYQPLLKKYTQIEQQRMEASQSEFRDCDITCCNVLLCFLITILGKPLSLLDLNGDDESLKRKCNTHTLQCAHVLTKSATQCIGDPIRLLTIIEHRTRWSQRIAKSVDEMTTKNIFLIEDKLPLNSLAIYFYMLLVEGVSAEAIPKVYAPLFIFESGIYLVTELLTEAEPILHYRGVLLMKSLLEQLQTNEIPAVSLELPVHKQCCLALSNCISFSANSQMRQLSIKVLRHYILQFDEEGKLLVLKNLMRSTQNHNIVAYLSMMYKDLVYAALKRVPLQDKIPANYSGQSFRSMLQQIIFSLPQGAETDLLDYSERVICTLNILRFIAIFDIHNRTGFWDFVDEIERDYCNPLRNAINMSIAHHEERLKSKESTSEELKQLHLLSVSISNEESTEDSTFDTKLSRQKKNHILQQNISDFILMKSLLARATECLDATARKRKAIQQK